MHTCSGTSLMTERFKQNIYCRLLNEDSSSAYQNHTASYKTQAFIMEAVQGAMTEAEKQTMMRTKNKENNSIGTKESGTENETQHSQLNFN